MSNRKTQSTYDPKKEEYERWRRAEGACHWVDSQTGELKSGYTDDETDRVLLVDAKKLAMKLARNNSPVIKQKRLDRNGRAVYQFTALGSQLALRIRKMGESFCERYAYASVHPYIQAIVDIAADVRLRLCDEMYLLDKPAQYPEAMLEFSEAVKMARKRLRSRQFKDVVRNDHRRALSNCQSAFAYISRAFGLHSKLLILRVDLYYKIGERRGWLLRDMKHKERNFEEGDRAFESYIRAVREGRVVPGLCAWLVCREDGPARGLHYHLLVAMDGHRYRDAFGYSKKLGEYWVKCCGGDDVGSYFNTYTRASRNEYWLNGLGLVSVDDRNKLRGLREAIRYVTKEDYLIRPKYGTKRDFRRGVINGSNEKRGAPRLDTDNMRHVHEILDGAT